ncbi:MAG: ABC transporter ATP-binding protein [Thermodesulfatator sp.]|nr:MAG: ABC transporter ATP-binding protein [Thermodesulfatator sp.]
MERVVVEVKGLGKRFGRQKALEEVSLRVPQGVLFGVVGPDGAGKSTLLKIITGLLDFDQGEVYLFGRRRSSERDFEEAKADLCFMPQGLGANLYQELSVEENLHFFGKLRLLDPQALEQRKEELLVLTGLWPFRRRRVKHLSGGMKQKLAFICSVLHQPRLIVLDEPTTGVDPLSREEFWSLLAGLVWRLGVTALVSTTYLEEAERFEQLALMHQGRILLQGTPSELLSQVKGEIYWVQGEDPLDLGEKILNRGWHLFPYAGGFRVFVPREKVKEARTFWSQEALQSRPIAPSLGDLLLGLSPPEPLAFREKGARAPKTLETVVRTEDLTKEFGSFRAVEGVSLEIKAGEIFGLLGPNGAGKTTLIRMLCGLMAPTRGRALVAGYDSRKTPRELRENIGYLSQAFSLYRDLTVQENIRLMAGIYGLSGREARLRLKELLKLTGLEPFQNLRAEDLPLGLRQRLALACALIHRPRIVFLDEPTSGMDILGREIFWNLVFYLSRAQGLTCLVTTHYLAEAEHCDRLALMHRGRIVAYGRPEDLKRELEREAGRPYLISFEDLHEARERLKAERPVMVFGRRLRLFFPGKAEELEAYLRAKGLKALSWEKGEITMEDIFFWHTVGKDET